MSEYLQTLHRAHAERRERLFPVQAPCAFASMPTVPEAEPRLPRSRPRPWRDPAKRSRPIRGLTAQQLIYVVSREFSNVTPQDILAAPRSSNVIYARHLAMYLARELLAKRSFPELAFQFQKRDHTTILSACKKIALRLENNLTLQIKHATLKEKLRSWREHAG
jgi:hypothetical protein